MSAQPSLTHEGAAYLRAAPLTLSLPGRKSQEPCIASVQYLRTEETLTEMASRVKEDVHATFNVPAPDLGEKWQSLQRLATWLRDTIVERQIAQTACAERPFKVTVVGLSSKGAWTGFVEDLATADSLIKGIEESGTLALEAALTPVLDKSLTASGISGTLLEPASRSLRTMDEGRFWFSQPLFPRERYLKANRTA